MAGAAMAAAAAMEAVVAVVALAVAEATLVAAAMAAPPTAHTCGRSTACWWSRSLGEGRHSQTAGSCPDRGSPSRTSTCRRRSACSQQRGPWQPSPRWWWPRPTASSRWWRARLYTGGRRRVGPAYNRTSARRRQTRTGSLCWGRLAVSTAVMAIAAEASMEVMCWAAASRCRGASPSGWW